MAAQLSPEVYAALLVAKWAQEIGLPPGNLWEPVITRQVLREWRRLGGHEQAWRAVETHYTTALGL